MLNSFSGRISDTAKEFSRAPEMPFSKMVSKPWMFLHQHPRGITLKQLKSHTHRHGWGHLNKQVDMVDSDVQLINFKSFSVSNLPQEKLAIHSEPVKFERVFGIFNFPDKMESILSKAVFSGFQIHFSSPEHSSHYIQFNSGGLESSPSDSNHLTELNFWGSGNSSVGFKTEVSLPRM